MQLTVRLSVRAGRAAAIAPDPAATEQRVEPEAVQLSENGTNRPQLIKITDTQVIVFETLEAWLADAESVEDGSFSGGGTL